MGLGQGQALGFDCSSSTSTTIGQTTYTQQTVLLNTPLERKFASATEPMLRHSGRHSFKRVPCSKPDLMEISPFSLTNTAPLQQQVNGVFTSATVEQLQSKGMTFSW